MIIMRILYLDLDTLRPDHLGCYGYIRNTSPNIDRVARQAVRFDNCYCSDAPCLPSRTALMTGRFGIHTGVVGHGGTAADIRLEGEPRGFRDTLTSESLPAFLRSQGFKTISISPFAERHSSWSFYAGFSEMHNTGKEGMESAEDVTPTALKWIQNNAKEDDWFLQLNYWDAHTPYRAPEEFGNPFENDPLPEWITQEVLDSHLKHVGPHTANEISMYDDTTDSRYPRHPGKLENMKKLRRMIDGYDCGISYMDSHIGTILDAFEKQGVLENMVIIVSADHGENMGELGIYGEHATADNMTCRIPMIVKWPGCKAGHVDRGLHYNLDLAPTLAGLLNTEPAKSWDGVSYAPAIINGEDCGREYIVISQCAHVCQRSVRFGSWLYMRTYHDGFHLFPDEMLFNVEEDPYEQNNMAVKKPGICREAVYYLNQWHDDMMKTMPYEVDPMWTVIKEGGPLHAKGYLKDYCERLKQTGRVWAVDELAKRHPWEFR
jgi:choline-sulfatase